MVLRVGQLLRGGKWSYQLTHPLKKSCTVFKARVLPGLDFSIPAEWAVVKTAEPSRMKFLNLEHMHYKNPIIASCPYIRAMYDTVCPIEDVGSSAANNPLCLVFEWMDHTLATLPSNQYRPNSNLPKKITEAGLSAIALLKNLTLIHTDIKPSNVLVSNVEGSSPVVKVGDLGMTTLEGYSRIRLQPLAFRAPEVWRGIGCFHSSDVWSFAATLVDWLSPRSIFGTNDNRYGHNAEAWCMAKLIRLFEQMPPPVDNPVYQAEFKLAELLEKAEDSKYPTEKLIMVRTLGEELERIGISSELSKFILYLLKMNHEERPTAEDALQSSYYQDWVFAPTERETRKGILATDIASSSRFTFTSPGAQKDIKSTIA